MRQIAVEPDRGPMAVPANGPMRRAALIDHAAEASALMKAMGHEGRIAILCHLSAGECSVTELERLLGLRQAAVSQQLARLRADGLVACRRDGKARFYAIADPRVAEILTLMTYLFGAQSR